MGNHFLFTYIHLTATILMGQHRMNLLWDFWYLLCCVINSSNQIPGQIGGMGDSRIINKSRHSLGSLKNQNMKCFNYLQHLMQQEICTTMTHLLWIAKIYFCVAAKIFYSYALKFNIELALLVLKWLFTYLDRSG